MSGELGRLWTRVEDLRTRVHELEHMTARLMRGQAETDNALADVQRSPAMRRPARVPEWRRQRGGAGR